jgi:hypothetical protein
MTIKAPDNEHPFFVEMRDQMQGTEMPTRRWILHPSSWHRASPPSQSARLAFLTLALGVALTSLVIGLRAGSDPPAAYAVTLDPGHSVTISLGEFRDIDRLNHRLAALGTRIRAVPVVPGCHARVHSISNVYGAGFKLPIPGPPKTLLAVLIQPGLSISSETITTSTLPGRTMVIPVTHAGFQTGFEGGVSGVVEGAAPRCVGVG